MKMPETFNYAGRNTDAKCFMDAAGNDYYFSYRTLVAFRTAGDGALFVHTNNWSVTTGKHLNAIDGGDEDAKKARLGAKAFRCAYDAAFSGDPVDRLFPDIDAPYKDEIRALLKAAGVS